MNLAFAVQDIHWKGIGLLAPELCLVVVSLIVLVQDLVQKGRDSSRVGYVTLAGLALKGLLLVLGFETHEMTSLSAVLCLSLPEFRCGASLYSYVPGGE